MDNDLWNKIPLLLFKKLALQSTVFTKQDQNLEHKLVLHTVPTHEESQKQKNSAPWPKVAYAKYRELAPKRSTWKRTKQKPLA